MAECQLKTTTPAGLFSTSVAGGPGGTRRSCTSSSSTSSKRRTSYHYVDSDTDTDDDNNNSDDELPRQRRRNAAGVTCTSGLTAAAATGGASGTGQWVRLSKNLLLQLVERICLLSFQQQQQQQNVIGGVADNNADLLRSFTGNSNGGRMACRSVDTCINVLVASNKPDDLQPRRSTVSAPVLPPDVVDIKPEVVDVVVGGGGRESPAIKQEQQQPEVERTSPSKVRLEVEANVEEQETEVNNQCLEHEIENKENNSPSIHQATTIMRCTESAAVSSSPHHDMDNDDVIVERQQTSSETPATSSSPPSPMAAPRAPPHEAPVPPAAAAGVSDVAGGSPADGGGQGGGSLSYNARRVRLNDARAARRHRTRRRLAATSAGVDDDDGGGGLLTDQQTSTVSGGRRRTGAPRTRKQTSRVRRAVDHNDLELEQVVRESCAEPEEVINENQLCRRRRRRCYSNSNTRHHRRRRPLTLGLLTSSSATSGTAMTSSSSSVRRQSWLALNKSLVLHALDRQLNPDQSPSPDTPSVSAAPHAAGSGVTAGKSSRVAKSIWNPATSPSPSFDRSPPPPPLPPASHYQTTTTVSPVFPVPSFWPGLWTTAGLLAPCPPAPLLPPAPAPLSQAPIQTMPPPPIPANSAMLCALLGFEMTSPRHHHHLNLPLPRPVTPLVPPRQHMSPAVCSPAHRSPSAASANGPLDFRSPVSSASFVREGPVILQTAACSHSTSTVTTNNNNNNNNKWIVLDKCDVSSLVDTLVDSMIAAPPVVGTNRASSTSAAVSSVHQSNPTSSVGFRAPQVATALTGASSSSSSSSGTSTTPASPPSLPSTSSDAAAAAPPGKWKSNLMQRLMRAEEMHSD